MIEVDSSTPAIVLQASQADHEALEWTIRLAGDDRRAKRSADCGRALSKVFRCRCCGLLRRARCSCRERLCPKERSRSLSGQVASALTAAAKLEHPSLHVAIWVEPDASWDKLTSGRKRVSAGQDVRFYAQDLRPHQVSWQYSVAWIAEGPAPEVPDVETHVYPVNLAIVEAALGSVRTSISDFDRGDARLAEYVAISRNRHAA